MKQLELEIGLNSKSYGIFLIIIEHFLKKSQNY